jgi:hypothetical protein
VPRDFDPLKSVIASLASKSSADENEVEANRFHAVLHPGCFEKLVAAFGYSLPEERMELPRFFSEQMDDQSPPRQRSAPAELSAEELAELNDMLAEQAGRRRRSSPTTVIRILVDGVERGRLNPVEQSSISFSARGDAEVLEVKTTDSSGELLLATHLLGAVGIDKDTIVSSIRLEGGQDLSLRITKGATDFLVTFGYRETDPRRAARLWWQRLNLRLISPRPILVGSAVVIICLTSFLAYVSLKSRRTSGPTQNSSAQTAQVVNLPSVEPPKATRPAVAPSVSQPPRKTAKIPSSSGEATRGGDVVANLKLSEVKKIYVDLRGDEELRSSIIKKLNSSGVVAATTDANEADAALKITVSQTGASAQLVNARGTVLWRKAGKSTAAIVNDLLSEIR